MTEDKMKNKNTKKSNNQNRLKENKSTNLENDSSKTKQATKPQNKSETLQENQNQKRNGKNDIPDSKKNKSNQIKMPSDRNQVSRPSQNNKANNQSNDKPKNQQNNQSGNQSAKQAKKQKANTSEHNKAAVTKSPKRVSRKVLRRRRFIRNLIGLFFVAIIVTAAIITSFKMLFIVRSIEVTGSEIFSQEEIVKFCNIVPESPIFAVNAKELEEKLATQYNYLETVKVSRKLPDKLLITLTDSKESYYTKSEENIKIYSQSFRFLRTTDTAPTGAICLEVDMTNENLLDIAKQVLVLFEQQEMYDLNELSVVSDVDIKAVYQNRFEISLGTMLDMDYKIKMCKSIILQKISTEEKGTLDASKGGEIVYKRQ